MVEFGRVTRKGIIRATNEKLSERVSNNYLDKYRRTVGREQKNGRTCMNTRNWKNPGEYQGKVESVRVPKNFTDQYRKMVEFVSVPENGRIRASTGKK